MRKCSWVLNRLKLSKNAFKQSWLYFHQLKQIESIREKEVEQTFVIGVSGWSNIPHSATTPQSAIINKTYNLREAA